MDQPDIISIHGLKFAYDGHQPVLDGVNFSLGPGHRAGLTGANGSGKSTLLQIIMGLARPSAGRLVIFGLERRQEADFLEVRRRIGFLFQDADDQLFCPTVAEDVAFGPLNLGLGHHKARERVKDTLNMLGLSGFESRITYKLSGGEKKLVALATVLAMGPEVLLLDEPTSGLDEATTERIARVLGESDQPYLIISHDQDFLRLTTTRQYRLKQGKIHSANSD